LCTSQSEFSFIINIHTVTNKTVAVHDGMAVSAAVNLQLYG